MRSDTRCLTYLHQETLIVSLVELISIEKKVLIFDMDETLIHCVDDIENEDPDIIIPIDFPDEEETVNVSFNH
jgi:hypothetical protein